MDQITFIHSRSLRVFENDKMIDFTICSQSLGTALAQQGERKSLIPVSPCFISHCKCVCPPLPPHLYSPQEPLLPHSERLSLLCLSHMPSVSPIMGQLRCSELCLKCIYGLTLSLHYRCTMALALDLKRQNGMQVFWGFFSKVL